MKIRVGILGYGNLGRYLTKRILEDDSFHLAFVWNRTRTAFGKEIGSHLILDDFSQLPQKDVDIVIEVAHPLVTREHGEQILKHCHYLLGSPSILADPEVEKKLISAASNHAVFIPSGAFWGGEDIRKMADAGTLKSLQVTIKKHPRSLKLQGEIAIRNAQVLDQPVTLFRGAVRKLCLMAPQNTNFMAAAAVAAHNLGFDNVEGCLISDSSLENWHIVEIEAKGHPKDDGSCFTCSTVRKNPSALGAVTGSATYEAFFQSLKSRTLVENIKCKASGFHLC